MTEPTHLTCPESGAWIFKPTEGEMAIEVLKRTTKLMLDIAQKLEIELEPSLQDDLIKLGVM